ncbi:hypothetical protein [Pararhizobium sp. LjRoot238]|uniref:hypothetical protein n=1 Tax=Pararhizobium sp. LjRoot238 TaxID=3342293 RepID=UPI003ED1676B
MHERLGFSPDLEGRNGHPAIHLPDQGSPYARSGIVHKHPNPTVVTQPGSDRGTRIGEISQQDADSHTRLVARLVTSDRHEIMSAAGEPLCMGRADARGGPRDEASWIFSHDLVLSRGFVY